jgi:hypothetical protein
MADSDRRARKSRYRPAKRLALAIAASTVLISTQIAGGGSSTSAAVQQRGPEGTVVFESGTEGYHTFRIPAIVQAADGTLLAFAEGRADGGGDTGTIDLVLKRSADGAGHRHSVPGSGEIHQKARDPGCRVVEARHTDAQRGHTWPAADGLGRQRLDRPRVAGRLAHVPGAVGKDLHLDVPRPRERLLEEHPRVAEGALGQKILGDLVKLSSEFGTKITIRNGVGYVDLGTTTNQR